MKTYICQNCKQSFERNQNRIYLFCSRICYHKYGNKQYKKGNPKMIEHKCKWCGNIWKSLSSAGAKTQYCSRSCQAYARTRILVPNQLNISEAAYLAGILDGEGSIGIFDRRKTRPNSIRPSLKLSIGNTDKSLMDWICKTTGIGKIEIRTTNNILSNKPMYYWHLNSISVLLLLKQLLPYLIIKHSLALSAFASQPKALLHLPY